MAEAFLGEIQIYAFTFPPKGWALCNGQLLGIQQNQALFSLLGTTYGGDGITVFALPNLRSRAPMHVGQGPGLSSYTQGETGGQENVTLTSAQIPAHTHTLGVVANTAGNQSSPIGNKFASAPAGLGVVYGGAADGTGSFVAIPSQGGGAHSNMQPYLVLNFCIALQGFFPSRN